MNPQAMYAAIAFTICSFGALGVVEYTDSQVEKEAIKAGLIQKVDPSTRRVIWVKPEPAAKP